MTRTRLAAVLTMALVLVAVVVPSSPARRVPRRVRLPEVSALSKLPKPNIGGAAIVAGLEEFVEKFPLRYNSFVPTNPAAARFLEEETKRLGYDTRIRTFSGQLAGLPDSGRVLRVVEAVKRGTHYPDEYIAFTAHYDGGAAQVHGAYDNGSGVNMLRFFARAFSKIETKRSILLLWFDGEEDGLLGSERYARMARETDMDIRAVLGFDMVGIGHPAPYCICVFHGGNPGDVELARPLIDLVNFQYLNFPRGDGGAARWPVASTGGHVCSCGRNSGASDERAFEREGFFTMRWRGMRDRLDYPGYHMPWDTVEFMEVVARGRENLEKGMKNTFVSAYYTALTLDGM